MIGGSAYHGHERVDAVRTRNLEVLGYAVFRLTAEDVQRSPVAAAHRVAAAVAPLRRLGV